jgi:hypothetical protein
MSKAMGILKVCTIILNTLFLATLILLCIQTSPFGSNLILAVIIFFFPLINLLVLLGSGKLLMGTKGIVFATLSVISSVIILLIIVLIVGQSGVPDPAGLRAVLVLWIISPLLTIPAVILLRARTKKETSVTGTIICPHCGGDVNI